MRIVFTGGSGKAGRHAIPYLLSQGHEVLNLDLNKLDHQQVMTLKTDLTDSGQVFNALTSLFSQNEYNLPQRPPLPDAVVHFAAYPCNLLVPDNTMFQSNVAQTYNVVEAACKLGIKKIIIASSETTYGVCFAQGEHDFASFPLDEDLDVNPEDSYALSKVCGEKIARSFARRFSADIYAFRIGNVIEPHEYAKFNDYLADPPLRKRNAWSYVDARDLGKLCHCALNTSGLGYQVFNATNDTITLKEKTVDVLRRECPSVEITREMDEYEAPLSNRKARRLLGFKEDHDWKRYL